MFSPACRSPKKPFRCPLSQIGTVVCTRNCQRFDGMKMLVGYVVCGWKIAVSEGQ